MNSKRRLILVAIALLAPQLAYSQSDDLDALRRNTESLIQDLVRSGVLAKDSATTLLTNVKPVPPPPIAPVVQEPEVREARAPALTESMRNELKEELRKEIMAQTREEALSAGVRNEIKEELRREIMAQAKTEGWAPTAAPAAILETGQTTVNLIQALVQSGILTQDRAEALIRDAKRAAAETTAAQNAGNKVVRVPYVPITVRNEIKEELRKEVMAQAKEEGWAAPAAVPSWLDGLTWESDVRLRAQQDRFASSNFTPLQLSFVQDPITISNSHDTNDNARLRLRFGFEKKLTAMTTAGFRLATGNFTNPLSTNQTLGNNLNRYTFGVDRALLRLHPVDWLTVTGGRIANPFFSTDLVWHPDLSLDGAAATLNPHFSESTSAYLTVGGFPLTKIDPSPNTAAPSKWLFGAQAGVDWRSESTGLKFGVALYDWKHIQGIPNTGSFTINPISASLYDATAPAFRQKGNSIVQLQAVDNPTILYGLASKFRELNLTGSVDFAHFDPVHVVLTGDFVKNIGFDRAEILQRTGRDLTPKTMGYQARLTVGQPQIRQRHDWQISAAYRYLERDAVLDAYADSDFRLGGTDSRGYIIGGNYGIDKNTWLSFKWLSADPINGPPLSIDVIQIDLNARF